MASYQITIYGTTEEKEETKHFIESALEKTAKANAYIQRNKGLKTVNRMVEKGVRKVMGEGMGGISVGITTSWEWKQEDVLIYNIVSSIEDMMSSLPFDMMVKGLNKNGLMKIERIKLVKKENDKRYAEEIPDNEKVIELQKVVYDGRTGSNTRTRETEN